MRITLIVGALVAASSARAPKHLASALFYVGLFGFASVFVVCLTCLVLGLTTGGAKRLKAFAHVLRGLRGKS